MKKIFSKVLYNDNELVGSNIQKLELEYYKVVNEPKKGYGIEITKKELCDNRNTEESKHIDNLTTSESLIDKLLEILSINKVTPVASEDVICDFFEEYRQTM